MPVVFDVSPYSSSHGAVNAYKLGLVDHGGYDILRASDRLIEVPAMQFALGAALGCRSCHCEERLDSRSKGEVDMVVNGCLLGIVFDIDGEPRG